MRALAVILATTTLIGCGAPRQAGYTQSEAPISARCEYEARAAFAGARGRSIGDTIDNMIQEGKLARLCMAASAESRPYNPPAILATAEPSRVIPRRPSTDTAAGRPEYCSDPAITNPRLLEDCRR